MMRYIKIMLLSVVLFCSYNMMAQTYDLHICGTQVTKENCADLSVIQGITLTKRDGKAEYSPTLNVLFLKDVMIVDTSGTAITSSLDNLTIVVNGTVNILSKAIRGIGLQLNKATNLRGGESSKMNLTTGGVGIMLDSSLSISNLQLKVTSENYGIGGNTSIVSLRKTYLGSLSIKGKESIVEVYGKTGSIISLDKLELSDGLGITSPSGATFYNHNVSLSGSTVKDETVVIQYAEMSSHKKGDVNLDGSVDISDIVAVINQIAGTATYSNADVNGDTNVDISDIVAIINIIANGSDDEDPEKPEEPDAAVKAGYCPDNHHPHMIDFGEGKKWACCNVGASAPWEYGNYYAWGELEPKDIYTWDNYTFLKESTEESDYIVTIQSSENDVAYQTWGGMWCIPDETDIEELEKIAHGSNNKEWTTLNGVKGWKVTKNNHAIFLPAAGLQGPDGPENVGEKGSYWTSQRSYVIYSSAGIPQHYPYAWILPFNDEKFIQFTLNIDNSKQRCLGLPVRPIINEDLETDDLDISVFHHICPDPHHPHEIDMGGGGIWLCCNLGASVPWEYGSYYAWGETEANKKSYEWSTYTFSDGDDYNGCLFIGNDIGGTAYDAVRKQMGDPWSMPSAGQAQWLSDNCTFEWLSMHSISGLKVTAPNGNSLFLPASGCKTKNGSYHITPNEGICYSLSSMHMVYPYMNKTMETSNSASMNVTSANRCIGQSLRPVKHNTPEEPSVAAGICPDSHHPHAIDLGTGVKWSCCNLGASAPWHYGNFYAWGETSTKSDYDVDTYSFGDGTFENFTEIGTDIAGTEYDAAHILWGNSWTMPSYEQAQLLAEGCTVTWTNLDGIDGVMLTGENGNRIFLPFTGGFWGEKLNPTNGGLWTSTVNDNEDGSAHFLDITYDFTDQNNLIGDVKPKSIWRFIGKAIRPVK